MSTFLQQLINGIAQGSAYALIALGYTMVYGVLRLINFAHSDVYMVGAFSGYFLANNRWIQAVFGNSVLGIVAIMVGAMVICAALGIIIERFGYRPGRSPTRYVAPFWFGILGLSAGGMIANSLVSILSGGAVGVAAGLVGERLGLRPVRQGSRLTLLILAIGISLLLENGGQQVFGADPKFFPEVIPTTLIDAGPLKLDTQRLTVLAVSVILMIALNIVVNHTRTGKAMRAVSFNVDAAKLMGINTDRIIAFTFALGSALAGAGGILVSLLYPKIDPLMGVMPGLKAFVAAVLGGIGSITGAMLGGLILGLAEVMAVGYGQSTYRDAIAFVVLVLILLLKPDGIMGKGTSEKV